NEITIVNGAGADGSTGEDNDESEDDEDDEESGNGRNRGRRNNQDSGLPDDTLLLAASVITIDLGE
ncbi:MAG: hypothetical protein M3440_03460, partial [Chloroflexota bacterium]|nr:hypothetical protein [Chloroflexota bacterium]